MLRNLLSLTLIASGSLPLLAADKPNIVFIMADDLGWTDLSCQGSKYYESPHIDRFAAEGLRFTDGYTCGPNCQPTRAALMSGQYGPRTGVYTVGSIDRFEWQTRPLRPVDNVDKLPLDKTTLGQAMKQAGYTTALFGKWHLGNDDAHHPLKRGFDESIVSMGQHFNFNTTPKTTVAKDVYLADFLTDKAVDFITRHKDRPFFLCLHHFAVHSPHEAKGDMIARFRPKPPVGGHRDPTYAGMIASVDESVGRVVKTLDDLGLGTKTLVIFTSDNGGVGGYEREGIKKGRNTGGITDNFPLRSGKGSLYEGGVRVPWMARWPGKIPAGKTTSHPITSVDLFPTCLELAGSPPPNQPLDGVSLVKTLQSGGEIAPNREALYWHFPGYLGAGGDTWRTTPVSTIRAGDWKLLEFFEDNRLELYNLKTDLSEKTNLAERESAKREELHAKLKDWRAAINAPIPQRTK